MIVQAPPSEDRRVMIDRVYGYTLRDGTGVRLVGYAVVCLETGWHLKRVKRRCEATRWAERRGWKIVEK